MMKHVTKWGSRGVTARAVLGTFVTGLVVLGTGLVWFFRLMPRRVGGRGLDGWVTLARVASKGLGK